MKSFIDNMQLLLNSEGDAFYGIQGDEKNKLYPWLCIRRGGILCTLNIFFEITSAIQESDVADASILNVEMTSKYEIDGYEILLTRLIEMIDEQAFYALMVRLFSIDGIFIDWGELEKEALTTEQLSWYNSSTARRIEWDACFNHLCTLFYDIEKKSYMLLIHPSSFNHFHSPRIFFISISDEKAKIIHDAVSFALSNRVRRAKKDEKEFQRFIKE